MSIHAWLTGFRFWSFLETLTQLQTTRSPRLLNGFWCFLVQNEEEILLVLFLFSTVYFCWVENDENPDWSKKVGFIQVFFTKVMLSAELECQQKMFEKHENNAYCHIPTPLFFLYTFQVANLKIWNQTEHLAMWLAGSRKYWRNENHYSRTCRCRI